MCTMTRAFCTSLARVCMHSSLSVSLCPSSQNALHTQLPSSMTLTLQNDTKINQQSHTVLYSKLSKFQCSPRVLSSVAGGRSDGRSPVLVNDPGASYESIFQSYDRSLPQRFNIGDAICDRHVRAGHGDDVALLFHGDDVAEQYTFAQLQNLSNRFANGLKGGCHIARGDRVGIYLPQCAETAITHVSLYKMGAISLPLFTLFGPEAIEYRVSNSGASCVVTDMQGLQTIMETWHKLPELKSVVVVRPPEQRGSPLPENVHDFYHLVEASSSDHQTVDTAAEDPALIIYTSGTTGNPKGCVHAHRVLLGHLPGVELPQNFFPKPNDLFWTPADWAWIGGLLDVLLPSLYHRVPVLAHRARKFDPDEAFYLMDLYKVQNVFMPATALKLIRSASTKTYKLRSLGSGGETLGEKLLEWGRATFGTTINEFYGQTECNLIMSNCSELFPVRPGSIGRPVPGKRAAIIDEQGNVLGPGEKGDIAVLRPDSTMLLEYWGMPEATANKFRGEWLVTGDQGYMDDDGYYWFFGRDDDIITSAGYRIGPGEVEDCLIHHPKVALAAVIGKPDPLRTELVKAFVVLRDEYRASAQNPDEAKALASEIQNFVKAKLARHEYPREVEFVNELPTTTTGKVIRKALKQLEKDRAEAAAATAAVSQS
jgi:acetyl-CoA synthetase